MAVNVVGVGSIQPGRYIVLEGEPCKVADVQTSKPGKHGHAKVRILAIGIIDGKKRDVVMPGHDNVDVPIVEKKSAQVLSITGDSANVMDSENFETFDLKIPEELKGQVVEGSNVLYWLLMGQRLMKQLKGGKEE
jgi:translation initiation factor 5A